MLELAENRTVLGLKAGYRTSINSLDGGDGGGREGGRGAVFFPFSLAKIMHIYKLLYSIYP